MKGFQLARCHLAFAAALAMLFAVIGLGADATPDRTRVLLVHGGHDFETNQFLKMFRDNPGITLSTVEHPKAHAWFKPARAREYDVLVFYDMWQEISEEAKRDLLQLIQSGKPLVALHHSVASYQDWAEYGKLIGGRYHLKEWVEDGTRKPGSTYQHDVQFTIRVADREHPVTRGLSEFKIHDETYGGFEVKPGVHVLLTTDEPSSGRGVAWTTTYGAGRVVYIQLGHDHLAYENPNFKRLVGQAIDWAAQRD